MKVEQLMTRELSVCTVADTLNRAAELMWESDCGCILVIGANGDGQAVGVVTDRDIAMAAYTQGKELAAIPVATAMAHNVIEFLQFQRRELSFDVFICQNTNKIGHILSGVKLEVSAKTSFICLSPTSTELFNVFVVMLMYMVVLLLEWYVRRAISVHLNQMLVYV